MTNKEFVIPDINLDECYICTVLQIISGGIFLLHVDELPYEQDKYKPRTVVLINNTFHLFPDLKIVVELRGYPDILEFKQKEVMILERVLGDHEYHSDELDLERSFVKKYMEKRLSTYPPPPVETSIIDKLESIVSEAEKFAKRFQ
eukprot:TRINITY_DN12980_c0_g1_i1.p1 TRINITY_DN12980_c0_g1~~TRINITY_DN12980_c0_g1_i1.p1  ORF type:complete len:146 (-),score=30.99 TRINITY_DN12980_c0_g1_i1:862-1299(-)